MCILPKNRLEAILRRAADCMRCHGFLIKTTITFVW